MFYFTFIPYSGRVEIGWDEIERKLTGSDLTESILFDGSTCPHDPVPHSSNPSPSPNPFYFTPNGAPFRQLHMLNVYGTMQDRCDAM